MKTSIIINSIAMSFCATVVYKGIIDNNIIGASVMSAMFVVNFSCLLWNLSRINN